MPDESEDLDSRESWGETPPPSHPWDGGAPGGQGPAAAPPEITRWRTIGYVAVTGLVVVLSLLVLYSFLVQGRGREPSPAPAASVEIVEPIDGAVLDTAKPVSVRGIGTGLPEGNVVVRAVDESDNVLAEAATIVVSEEAGLGGTGPWSVQFTIRAEPATPGRILAFSTSPADGSTIAFDAIAVLFGSPPPRGAFIQIREPLDGSTLDISRPVSVSGIGAGLDEGNVVVQALDHNNDVLAEAATTIIAPDAGTGGQGPWSVQLTIRTDTPQAGRIVAFSTSLADGSSVASNSVDVFFRAAEVKGPFIEIDSPGDGAVVDIAGTVTISGMGGGLFEGNVVVRATGSDGTVLAEAATIIVSPDAGTGGSGPWSISLDIPAEAGSTGQIIAFSTSPLDGSITASDSVTVTYGMGETSIRLAACNVQAGSLVSWHIQRGWVNGMRVERPIDPRESGFPSGPA